jgi:epoxyqueuosine reductase
MPGARSVISLLYSYYPTHKPAEEGNYILAKYAYGKDYHVLIRKRLDQVIDGIHKLAPEAACQPFCDSGVLMEKAWGQQCGVGWRGKNTILINKTGGSFFFIGVILTDLEPEPDRPEPDRCGNCQKCMDACPTGALEQPHVLNPLKCIAYHTIEERKQIPAEIALHLSNRIYGCDICQDVCPFNRAPALTREPLFEPHPRLLTMDRAGWETLSKEDFDEIFRGTPVARAGYEKLMSNIRQAAEGAG